MKRGSVRNRTKIGIKEGEGGNGSGTAIDPAQISSRTLAIRTVLRVTVVKSRPKFQTEKN